MKKRFYGAGIAGPVFQTSLIASLVGFGMYFDHAAPGGESARRQTAAVQATTGREGPSAEVRQMARWAVAHDDNAHLPFLVVDKARAKLFAFDAEGRLKAGAPVLLGAARGDGPAAPDTPAGRFVADTWLSASGDGIVWVNGQAALSLHGMPSTQSPGRGTQRLASPRVEDKRISDGSLHVAGQFYRDVLVPLKGQLSVAYVLPEEPPTSVAQFPRPTSFRSPS